MAAKNIQLRALRHWVTESTRNAHLPGNAATIEQRVQQLLDQRAGPGSENEQILWRIHARQNPAIVPRSWFATGPTADSVIGHHTSGDPENWILFKIHVLPDVLTISVDDLLEDTEYESANYKEGEVIVNGGGIFYAKKNLSAPGFQDIAPTRGVPTKETWYTNQNVPAAAAPAGAPPRKRPVTITQLMERAQEMIEDFGPVTVEQAKTFMYPYEELVTRGGKRGASRKRRHKRKTRKHRK